jgi:hypothetical protein
MQKILGQAHVFTGDFDLFRNFTMFSLVPAPAWCVSRTWLDQGLAEADQAYRGKAARVTRARGLGTTREAGICCRFYKKHWPVWSPYLEMCFCLFTLGQ